MALNAHQKNNDGRIRKERKDSLLGNLAKEYPALENYNPRMQLGTLEKKLKVDSLRQVLKQLKKG